MPYRSTKTYGHECGLSVAFRQWKAESHCRWIHGYALSIKLEFESDELDYRNWVFDFGGMKSFKGWLETTFDHTLLVAQDDPYIDEIKNLGVLDIANVIVFPVVSCEAFAKLIFDSANLWLDDQGLKEVRVVQVEVKEHGANGAMYFESRQTPTKETL